MNLLSNALVKEERKKAQPTYPILYTQYSQHCGQKMRQHSVRARTIPLFRKPLELHKVKATPYIPEISLKK
jgi:hypothetical protein